MVSEDVDGQVFNIGSTEEISILDLAHRVREAAQSDSQIDMVPYQDAYEPGFEDMPRRIPDVRKIEGALGWRPTRDLAGILDDVVRSERQAGTDVSAVGAA
jgi:UDP-glucose 4-epimerase